MATTILGFLLLAGPARAADPLPSLPGPLPTLPLPTLPLPTLPLPTLPLPTLPPVPTPTLTLPTPTLPLPTPTLPLFTPTLGPTSTSTPAPSAAYPSAGASFEAVGPGSSGTSFGGPIDAQPVAATGVPSEPLPPSFGGLGSLFDTLGLPGLVIGIPAFIILGILGVQLAVGAAWVPVIRRWLNRRA